MYLVRHLFLKQMAIASKCCEIRGSFGRLGLTSDFFRVLKSMRIASELILSYYVSVSNYILLCRNTRIINKIIWKHYDSIKAPSGRRKHLIEYFIQP